MVRFLAMKGLVIWIFKIIHFKSYSEDSKSNIELTLGFIVIYFVVLLFLLITPLLSVLNISPKSDLFWAIQLFLIGLSYFLVFRYKSDIYSLYDVSETPELHFGNGNALIKLGILMGSLAFFILIAVFVFL